MNKLLKILLIGILLFAFYFTFSYATEENTENQDVTNEVIEETPTTGLSTLSSDTVTSISSLNSYSQANLELNNILCIILIAVGVVIILLAIAILIRTKK